nr:glycoside hydrolase family 2 TIM barrel-domain containing protein [uncultured Glaciecola sp.]
MKPSKILLSAFVTSILSATSVCHVAYAAGMVSSSPSLAVKKAGNMSNDAVAINHVAGNSHVAVKRSKIAIKNQTPIKVEIIEENGNYKLLRGGEPYQVRGAGISSTDLDSLVKFGGNSMRNWAVDNHAEPAEQLLDRAYAMGITVSLCLEFARERHGFDYDDNAAVAKQLAENRVRVEKYKDHPALLTWIIGNEVNFDFTNPKVFDAVNDTAKMIKELDPNHPTTTALAGFDKKALVAIAERAPDLDFISFQMYADLLNLPQYIKEFGFDKPYFITEWGAVGHWEVHTTEWGAPVENTSTEKASNYSKSYSQVLESL